MNKYTQIKSMDEVFELIVTKGETVYWVADKRVEKAIAFIKSWGCKYCSVLSVDKENLIILNKDHNDPDWGQVNEIELYRIYHGTWLRKLKRAKKALIKERKDENGRDGRI